MLTTFDRVGAVLVTSPARSHPSTDLVWGALGSFSLLRGLEEAPITVVCDGYRTPKELEEGHSARATARMIRDPCALSKRGIVAQAVGDACLREPRQQHLRRLEELAHGVQHVVP